MASRTAAANRTTGSVRDAQVGKPAAPRGGGPLSRGVGARSWSPQERLSRCGAVSVPLDSSKARSLASDALWSLPWGGVDAGVRGAHSAGERPAIQMSPMKQGRSSHGIQAQRNV